MAETDTKPTPRRREEPMDKNAPPRPLGSTKEHLVVSPHDLTEDVDPAYAGEYELIHGTIRVPTYDDKGELLPGGKTYRAGQRFELNAIDAHRMLQLQVVKRVDGKRPDTAERIKSPIERAIVAA